MPLPIPTWEQCPHQATCPLPSSVSPSSSVSSLHPNPARREVPTSLQAALDRTQKKACQLLMEELLLDLQVRLSTAPEAGRAETNPIPARTALLPNPQAQVYFCSGSPPHTPWPAIILQTSCQSAPPCIAGADGLWSLTDRDQEPQSSWAASRFFLWLFHSRKPNRSEAMSGRGYKPMCNRLSCFLPA